jgi:hypothetical protein
MHLPFASRRAFVRALPSLPFAALLTAARPLSAQAQSNPPASAEVQSLQGTAQILDANQAARAAAVRGVMQVGERLVTSAGGEAVVKLADGSVIAVRPLTEFQLQDLRFSARTPQEGSVVLQLLRGGIRMVTGLVSKANPNNVRVITPTATIGVRGTDFEVTQLNQDGTQGAQAGAYTQVFSGQTTLENSQGERIEINPGQAAFAPLGNVLNQALQFGLLRNTPAGVFFQGRFDNLLNNLQQNLTNQINSEIQRQLNNNETTRQIQRILPGLGEIFKLPGK